ncbi:hypothetical protein RHMOL_Rhmol05G0220600 [Rhododendron molle]|uniref:Uncharacterized protein n=1 Tax=Rhododendron molle TaxID=49168 RepID=A0ACC0NTE0_RHOML|nr:hypothetical protein RHMOL_Rhmol05G0220600 [Rhododendron molle]
MEQMVISVQLSPGRDNCEPHGWFNILVTSQHLSPDSPESTPSFTADRRLNLVMEPIFDFHPGGELEDDVDIEELELQGLVSLDMGLGTMSTMDSWTLDYRTRLFCYGDLCVWLL